MIKKTSKSKKSSNTSNKVADIKSASTHRHSDQRKARKNNDLTILDIDQIEKQMANFIKTLVGAKKRKPKSNKTERLGVKISSSKKSKVSAGNSTKKKNPTRKKAQVRENGLIAVKSVTQSGQKKDQRNNKPTKPGGKPKGGKTRSRLSLVKH